MSQPWQDFIGSLSLPGAPCKLESTAVYPLTSQAFLQIAGPDAIRFLQGQLSCDVTQISLRQSGLGTHNTHQGRMRSSFRICQYAENAFLLRVHASIREQALAALAKYIVFSKAKISSDNNWAGIGLHGDKACKELDKHFSLVPDKDLQQHVEKDKLLICTSAELKSYEIYTDTANAIALWPQLVQNLPPRNATQHQLLENRLGLAFVEAGTYEAFIPQMFNYQATPAISFTKGCYTGQEIVARMKYLGKLKRHMHHYIADYNDEISVGDPVFSNANKQRTGDIVSAVKTGDKSWDLLIVLTDSDNIASSLHLKNGKLENIETIALPYKIEE